MTAKESRRILLVDDHAAVRHGLALVLAEEGVGECREADSRKDALEAASHERPDIALVDLSLANDEALDLIADLRALSVAVLVCSMHEEPSHVRRALAAGARGYITKREAPRELARAVRDVLEGWMLSSPRAAANLRDTGRARRPPDPSRGWSAHLQRHCRQLCFGIPCGGNPPQACGRNPLHTTPPLSPYDRVV